jgi:hypothetical protein
MRLALLFVPSLRLPRCVRTFQNYLHFPTCSALWQNMHTHTHTPDALARSRIARTRSTQVWCSYKYLPPSAQVEELYLHSSICLRDVTLG